MKRTLLLIASLLALCLCATAAASPYALNGPSGRLPITSVTDGNGEAVTALTDGSTATAWTKASDGAPDLTISLYYASVGEIWLQSGHCYSQNYYNHYDRPDTVAVTLWYASGRYETASVTYRYRLTDAFRPNSRDTNWIGGYQRLLLPEKIDGVTQIDLTIESVIQGYGRTGATITDIAITRGQHATSTPRNATATPRPYVQYITPTPSPVPEETDAPVVPTRDVALLTPVPTDPLVELLTPVPVTPTPEPDDPTLYPSQGIPAKLTKRMFTRSGPSTRYDEQGGFLSKGEEVNVISKVWDSYSAVTWFQVEVYRESNESWYRVYTPTSYVDLDPDLVPDETEEYERCWMIAREQARFGPGLEFGYNENYPLYNGAFVKLFCIEGDWAQVEYVDYGSNTETLRRAWVPITSLKPEE